MNRFAAVVRADDPPEPPAYVPVASRMAIAILTISVVGAAGSRGLPLPPSPDLYERTVEAVAAWPAWIGHGFEVVSELGLLVLAGGLIMTGVGHRRHVPRLARVLAAGSGVVAAYLISEGLKVAIAQPRPCIGLAAGTTVADCPSATDWSLPSNHAAIATALAVAIAFSADRAARWAVPLALLVCASRVIIGVHYPHDVLSGALLAAVIVTGTTLVLGRPAHVVAAHLQAVWSARRS